MKSKLLTSLKEPLDFDLQTVASELDTSASRLKYFSNQGETEDSIELDIFNKLFDSIKSEEQCVVSINDNTDLYECSDDSIVIVLYSELSGKYIIFDVQDTMKIEKMMSRYK